MDNKSNNINILIKRIICFEVCSVYNGTINWINFYLTCQTTNLILYPCTFWSTCYIAKVAPQNACRARFYIVRVTCVRTCFVFASHVSERFDFAEMCGSLLCGCFFEYCFAMMFGFRWVPFFLAESIEFPKSFYLLLQQLRGVRSCSRVGSVRNASR